MTPRGKYLLELPDYGSPLTIRHLLNHTSGLRDVFLPLEVSAPQDDNGDRNGLGPSPATALNFLSGGISKKQWRVCAAGDHRKRVSGQSLAAFARANIFNPPA